MLPPRIPAANTVMSRVRFIVLVLPSECLDSRSYSSFPTICVRHLAPRSISFSAAVFHEPRPPIVFGLRLERAAHFVGPRETIPRTLVPVHQSVLRHPAHRQWQQPPPPGFLATNLPHRLGLIDFCLTLLIALMTSKNAAPEHRHIGQMHIRYGHAHRLNPHGLEVHPTTHALPQRVCGEQRILVLPRNPSTMAARANSSNARSG